MVKCPYSVFLSSGCAVELESECGEADNSALIGQGVAIESEPICSPVTLCPEEQSTALTLPRGGCINSFAASFMLSKAPSVQKGSIYAVILVDSCGCGTFKVLPNAVIKLSSNVNKCSGDGAVFSALVSPNCVVTAGSRVLVAFYMIDDSCKSHICGYANASFCIV